MSVDLNDPTILHTRSEILSKSSPTQWFLLRYSSSTPPTLAQLAAGGAPVLENVREELHKTDEEVVFGYAEVRGKGLVVALIKDNVGGVRRARAVVHSRAVASLFPDYSALITVAHASQLDDEEVYTKLGFTHGYTGLPTPTPGSSLNRLEPTAAPPAATQAHDQSSSPAVTGASSSSSSTPPPHSDAPAATVALGAPLHSSDSNPNTRSTSLPHTVDLSPSPAEVTEPVPPVPEKDQLGPSSLSTPRREPYSTGHEAGFTSLHQPRSRDMGDRMPFPQTSASGQPSGPMHHPAASNRVVSAPATGIEMKGISSADMFETNRGQRKTSLSSRLGQLGSAFGRGSPKSSAPSSSSPASPMAQHGEDGPSSPGGSTKSPSSPTVSRFINSNLIKNFGRKASGSASPEETRATATFPLPPPPPLPPKDEVLLDEPARDTCVHHSSPARPSLHDQTPNDSIDDAAVGIRNGHGEGHRVTSALGAEYPDSDALARSPSGQKALFDASQKRLKDEMEIQERFRRDEERRRSKMLPPVGDHPNGPDDRFSTVAGIFASQNGAINGARDDRSGHDEPVYDEEDSISVEGLPYDRPGPESPEQSLHGSRPRREPQQTPTPAAARSLSTQAMHADKAPFAREPADPPGPHEGVGETIDGDESVTARIAELDLAEDGQAGGTGVEMSIAAERHAEEMRRQREAEEQEAARVEGERWMAERLRVEEEARMAKQRAEEARLVEEQRVEAERIAEEKRLEEERRAELDRQDKERQAEEARREQERVEAERRKKEDTINSLRRGKNTGGKMLSGWITAQSSKSTTWRRRYFELFSGEWRLFKDAGDAKPISVVPLGRDIRISQTYEESQVQDSFKLVDQAGEVWFLFADGKEDKETVLAALDMVAE